MKRLVLTSLFVLCVLMQPQGDARASSLEEGAIAFIKSMEREAMGSLTDPDKPRSERVEAFRGLFNERFAVQTIARWTLGRNWRRASDAEKAEFLELFEELMVATYVDRFQNYSGDGVEITKAVPIDDNRATVHSSIPRPAETGGKPIAVLWRVGRQGDVYKVLDVVVEGASMSITMQREFAAIIKNTGGVSGLIAELKKKTSQLNKS